MVFLVPLFLSIIIGNNLKTSCFIHLIQKQGFRGYKKEELSSLRQQFVNHTLEVHFWLTFFNQKCSKRHRLYFRLQGYFQTLQWFLSKSSRLCIQNAPKTSLISLTCRVHEDGRSAHETKVDLTVSRCSYSRSSRHVLAWNLCVRTRDTLYEIGMIFQKLFQNYLWINLEKLFSNLKRGTT